MPDALGWVRAGRESSVKEGRGIHDLKACRSRWKEVWGEGRADRAGGRARAKAQRRGTTEGGEAVVTDGSGSAGPTALRAVVAQTTWDLVLKVKDNW